MQQASEEHGVGGGGDFFQFEKSGVYKLRLLTPAFPIATHFFGKGVAAKVCYGADKGCPFHGDKAPRNENGDEAKPSVKFMAYVIDRRDGKVKMGELPWSVISAVTTFQEDEDYAFEDFPMPYDIKVTVDKDASAANIYKTLAVPARTDVTAEEMDEFTQKNDKKRPDVYIEQRKAKQRDKDLQNAAFDRGENMPQEDNEMPPDAYPDYPGDPTI